MCNTVPVKRKGWLHSAANDLDLVTVSDAGPGETLRLSLLSKVNFIKGVLEYKNY